MANTSTGNATWSARALLGFSLVIVTACGIVAKLSVDELSAPRGLFDATNPPSPHDVFVAEWILLSIRSAIAVIPALGFYWLVRSPLALGLRQTWTAVLCGVVLVAAIALTYRIYLVLDDGHLFEGDHRERISRVGKFAGTFMSMTFVSFAGGVVLATIGTAIKKFSTLSATGKTRH
jgi:hypothetical protein